MAQDGEDDGARQQGGERVRKTDGDDNILMINNDRVKCDDALWPE